MPHYAPPTRHYAGGRYDDLDDALSADAATRRYADTRRRRQIRITPHTPMPHAADDASERRR